MSGKTKLAAAVGFVAAVVVAAAAVAQPAAPAQDAAATQEQQPAIQNQGPAPAAACGRVLPRQARALARVVGSETKVRKPGGFAVIKLDTGKITAVGSSSVTIKRADGQTLTVQVADTTRLCRDGKPVSVGDFKVGDAAAVERVQDGDTTVVRFVRALSPEARDRLQQALKNRPRRQGAGRAGAQDQAQDQAQDPTDGEVAAFGL